METVKVSTSQHVDIDYPVAGIGDRLVSYLIDYGIFFGVYLVFIIALLLSNFNLGFNNISTIILLAIYAVCYIFYDLLCEIFMNGQTIGKRAMKIKVVSLDGGQPTIGQYLIRWVFRIVDFALTFGTLAFITVVISENKQRIGDMVAGTTVIKTKPSTTIDQIAFHPAGGDEYVPTFSNVDLLSDKDIELVHEVVQTYYKTQNPNIVYEMANRVESHLGITVPEGMNALDFLRTIAQDYNHITSKV